MSVLSVTPQHLRDTAKQIDQLASSVHQLPQLHADEVALTMPGLVIGEAIAHCNEASLHVSGVLLGRFQEFSHLLTHSADVFEHRDKANADVLSAAVAAQLDALGDFNDGNEQAVSTR